MMISCIGSLCNVWFMQDSGLDRFHRILHVYFALMF